jgi:hypothetical protein
VSALTVLAAAEEVAHREQRVDPINRRMSAKFDERETGKIQHAMGGQVQYELRLALSVTYWANQAQRREARRNAESALKDVLYRDVVSRLAQLRSMLNCSDRESVQLAITELMGELRP